MNEEALSALCTPALVVDVDKVKRNAQRMMEFCEKLGVQLRPHMKTHKTLYEHTHTTHSHMVNLAVSDGVCVFLCSSECADIMTSGSRRCIVVSTLAEACFYADHGFDDILYAYSLPFDKVLSTHTKKIKSI